MRWSKLLLMLAFAPAFAVGEVFADDRAAGSLPELIAPGEPVMAEPSDGPVVESGEPRAAPQAFDAAYPEYYCQPDCLPICPICLPEFGPQWFAYGWLEMGYTANFDSPFDRFNGPMGFNDRSNDFLVNQLYATAGRRVNRGCCWDWGVQVDLLYGSDYFFTQARGLETNVDGSPDWNSAEGPRTTPTSDAALYGLAMPQLFAEVYAPVACGLSFKFGHFYTTLGYEAVPAPENFFYSHTYMMVFGEPKTHTGILASYQLAPCFEINAGVTNGWDNFSDDNGAMGFLGGVSWQANDGSSAFSFQLCTGAEDPDGQNDRTVYSLIYTEELNSCLTYVFQHDLGFEQNAALRGNRVTNARWYGITQYLFYQVNCCWELGLRAEWFRDEHNARILGIPTDDSEGGNYFNLTLGANWRPFPRMVIRPELRWDTSDASAQALGIGGMFDAFRKQDQLTLSCDMVLFF